MTDAIAERPKLTDEQKQELIKATRGQLAMWRCHKEVLATKITQLSFGYDATYDAAVHLLIPEDLNLAPIRVNQEFMAKHNPVAPGYFVVYNAGTDKHYESWSPVEVFEDGYSPTEHHAQPDLVRHFLEGIRAPEAGSEPLEE